MQERFPFLNTAEGLRYCGNDEDFYLEMLTVFCEDAQPERLETPFLAEDWEGYRVVVHALKNEARTIGAQLLSEQARAQEMAVRGGALDIVRRDHRALTDSFGECLRRIREGLRNL